MNYFSEIDFIIAFDLKYLMLFKLDGFSITSHLEIELMLDNKKANNIIGELSFFL